MKSSANVRKVGTSFRGCGVRRNLVRRDRIKGSDEPPDCLADDFQPCFNSPQCLNNGIQPGTRVASTGPRGAPWLKVHEVEVGPTGWYHSSIVTAKPAELPSEVIRAEQAARVAAMFERWAAEDVSDEPDWDVDQVEQIAFPRPPTAVEPPRW